jgi:hydrogenase nickel incorporation protein HypB
MRSHSISIVPANPIIAQQNRDDFARAQLAVIALVGPPGAGKTAVLEATARQRRGRLRLAVIPANPAARRDADRLSRYCPQVQPAETATPDAAAVRAALRHLHLKNIDVLVIESMGGISGVPDFGQDATVTALCVSGGDDKAAEYASLLAGSQALLLCKSELQRHVQFDRGVFRADVRRINPAAEFIELSAFENRGLERWIHWIEQLRAQKRSGAAPEPGITGLTA